MEILPHEFISVVMSDGAWARVTAEPAEIELFCTAARVGCGDCCEFEPICGCIYHHEDVQLNLEIYPVMSDLTQTAQGHVLSLECFKGIVVTEC